MIKVSVGLIEQDDRILVAKRHQHQHQGGLWEFPGGKVEPDEEPLDALKRELKEEVALNVLAAEPLFNIEHEYTDKSVQLIIFKVVSFEGIARHCEGQEIQWLPITELSTIEVPQANQRIVDYILQQRK